MPNSRVLEGADLDTVLAELTTKNGTVQLQVPIDAKGFRVDARLLASAPGLLTIEQPSRQGRPVLLALGEKVLLRCSAPVGMIEAEAIVQAKLPGQPGGPDEVQLKVPPAFRCVQRRAGSRVPSRSLGLPATVFTDGGPVSGFTAEVHDMSTTGCALLLDRSAGGLLRAHTRITLRAGLPDDPSTVLELDARVVRALPVSDGFRVGIEFLFDAPNSCVLQSHLSKYTAAAQRHADRASRAG